MLGHDKTSLQPVFVRVVRPQQMVEDIVRFNDITNLPCRQTHYGAGVRTTIYISNYIASSGSHPRRLNSRLISKTNNDIHDTSGEELPESAPHSSCRYSATNPTHPARHKIGLRVTIIQTRFLWTVLSASVSRADRVLGWMLFPAVTNSRQHSASHRTKRLVKNAPPKSSCLYQRASTRMRIIGFTSPLQTHQALSSPAQPTSSSPGQVIHKLHRVVDGRIHI